MEVNSVSNPNSWFLSETVSHETAQQPLNEPSTSIEGEFEKDDLEKPIVNSQQSTETQELLQANVFSEEVRQEFSSLINDTDLNLAWYEGKEISSKEDLKEAIEGTVSKLYEQKYGEINDSWYNSKSPVFQQFAYMAELSGGDSNKLLELMNAESEKNSIEDLDTSDEFQAERIIRKYYNSINLAKELIEIEISDFKERDLIESRAEKFKPILSELFEKEKLELIKKQEEDNTNFYKAVEANHNEVVSFLSKKELQEFNLSEQDKDLVFDSLVYNNNINGFSIFQSLENLQEQKDYNTLAIISLLASDKKRGLEVINNMLKPAIAKDLKVKIKFASERNNSTNEDVSQTLRNPRNNEQQEIKAYKPW